MISVLYISSGVQRFSEDELKELLAKSRENNRRLGVTGMLLYHDINFMQLVEGPEEAVEGLMEKIARDPRHCGMVTLLKETVQKREFADWSMGFKNLTGEEELPEGLPAVVDNLNAAHFHQDPSLAHRVLLAFRESL